MTKKWRSIGVRTIAVLLILHFIVEVTGHHYLYRTLANTVFRGKLGPEITEYKRNDNRVISTGEKQPWPLSVNFQKTPLTAEELAYHQSFESVAFLVIHRDSMVSESYWAGFGADSISNSFSMAKSVVSLLTGVAIDRGMLKGVDQPLHELMPQFRTGYGEQLTIEHLLTMSAGFDFDEHYINPFAFPAKANYTDDLELLLKQYEPTSPPGEVFSYQSGTTQLLAQVLVDQSKNSLSHLASNWVWKRIGAEREALWSLDREEGMEKAFCCINATARDFARIGKLYLHGGKWNDETVVSEKFIRASLSPADLQNKDGTKCTTYGYQWWLSGDERDPFYFMRGIKGQYVLVDPMNDLIVVRLGKKRDKGSGERPHPEDVYRYLEMGRRMIKA